MTSKSNRKDWIDKSNPQRKQLHLAIDYYSPQKHADGQVWLKEHQRLHICFTPSCVSDSTWSGKFFRDLTQKQIRR